MDALSEDLHELRDAASLEAAASILVAHGVKPETAALMAALERGEEGDLVIEDEPGQSFTNDELAEVPSAPGPPKALTLARNGEPVATHLPFSLGAWRHPEHRGGRPVALPRPAPARPEEARVGIALADEDVTTEHTGAMIALYPLDPAALALTGDGAEPPAELHVTLAYLGNAVDLDAFAVEAARAAAVDAAGDVPAFDAFVAGCGTLGSEGAVVLFLEAQEINDLCESVWSQLDPELYAEQHDGFLPHLTLGYGVSLDAGLPLVGSTIAIASLALVVAGEVDPYPLGDDVDQAEDSTEITPTGDAKATTVKERRADKAASRRGPVPARPTTGRPVVYVDDAAPAASGQAASGQTDSEGTATIELAATEAEPIVVEDPTAPEGEMAFTGLLVVEGIESGDQRIITDNALTWRELPLPLMVMFDNPDGGAGHAGATIAGRIDNVWRHEERPNELWGSGVYDDSDAGREAYRMLQAKMLRGVSVDLDNVDVEWEQTADESDDPLEALFGDPGRMIVTSARIMGATQCGFPAFAEAHLEIPEEVSAIAASAGYVPMMRAHTLLDSTGALVASGGLAFPLTPPAAWFEKPDLDGPTPVRVDEDGRVYGHAAIFGTCHIGFAERCVDVPRSGCAYAAFRTGQTLTAEGTLVATGPIVTDTVHPDLERQASDAAAFYADSGCAVADVAVYEDRFGVVVAGALRSGATGEQVRALRGGDVSPDWRRVNGRLEAVAMLVVNNSGFKVPVALAASAGHAIVPGDRARGRMELDTGEVVSLVAAGRLPRRHADDTARRLDALVLQVGELSAVVSTLRADRARQLRASLRAEA